MDRRKFLRVLGLGSGAVAALMHSAGIVERAVKYFFLKNNPLATVEMSPWEFYQLGPLLVFNPRFTCKISGIVAPEEYDGLNQWQDDFPGVHYRGLLRG